MIPSRFSRAGATAISLVIFAAPALVGSATAKLAAAPAAAKPLPTNTGAQAPARAENSATQKTIEELFSKLEQSQPTEEMFNQLSAIIEKEPKNYRARLVLGDCYDKAGLPDQAIEQFKLAVQYGPHDPEGMVNLIYEQYTKGLKEEAGKILKEATKRFPFDPRVQYWNGKYLLDAQKGYLAEAYFRTALEKDPKLTPAAVDLAEVRSSQGRYYEALELVQKDLAVKREVQPPRPVFIRGAALLNLHRVNDAIPDLRYAFHHSRLEPKRAGYYAFACLMSHRYEEAIDPAIFNMAASATEVGIDSGAEQLFYDIAKHIPQQRLNALVASSTTNLERLKPFPAVRFSLGMMLQKLGDIDMSTMQFFICFGQDPNNAQAAFELARNLEMRYHLYDKALGYYERAHALDPSNMRTADYLERLKMRLPERQQDIAWQLKDWLRPATCPIQF
ncbi:MAG TPA: tetratricopeptide repeat protein [Chroococcales cyanobacterium]